MHSQTLMLFAGFLAYGVLTVVAAYFWLRWFRRKVHLRPADLQTAPDAWLAFWLPQAIAAEIWTLAGAGLMSFLFVIITPPLAGADGAMLKLGIVVGVMAMVAVCFAALDVVMVVRARQVARRH